MPYQRAGYKDATDLTATMQTLLGNWVVPMNSERAVSGTKKGSFGLMDKVGIVFDGGSRHARNRTDTH